MNPDGNRAATILIVEDEDLVARDLKKRLTELGYEVAGIKHSGQGAINGVEKSKPDIVLMDIMLKGDIDGVTAAGEIKSRFEIPVIYLTAYSDDDTLARAKITEPFGYLLKPFEIRELHTAIEIALYKHKMERELAEARANIKVLQGFLPICASCKKIRDDKGLWSQVESYIRDHSEADFTHSICPECVKKSMDELNSSS